MRHTYIDKFFKDKHGHWAIAQFPNTLLSVWIILVIIGYFYSDNHIMLLRNTVLFAWAYLELTQGSSYFRQTLGAFVLAGVVTMMLYG